MSDFGFWELALIMLLALLIVGPKRLPQLLSTIGHWIGRIKKLTAQFKAEFAEEAEVQDVKKILSDTQKTIRQTGRDIQREYLNTDPLVKAVEEQINEGRFKAHTKRDDMDNNEHHSVANETQTVEKKQRHNDDG